MGLYRGSVTVHYDPEREDHKQFEQTTAKKDKERIRDEPSDVRVVDDPVLPEVSHEKYYEANTSSLAELFGNKKQVRAVLINTYGSSRKKNVAYKVTAYHFDSVLNLDDSSQYFTIEDTISVRNSLFCPTSAQISGESAKARKRRSPGKSDSHYFRLILLAASPLVISPPQPKPLATRLN